MDEQKTTKIHRQEKLRSTLAREAKVNSLAVFRYDYYRNSWVFSVEIMGIINELEEMKSRLCALIWLVSVRRSPFSEYIKLRCSSKRNLFTKKVFFEKSSLGSIDSFGISLYLRYTTTSPKNQLIRSLAILKILQLLQKSANRIFLRLQNAVKLLLKSIDYDKFLPKEFVFYNK